MDSEIANGKEVLQKIRGATAASLKARRVRGRNARCAGAQHRGATAANLKARRVRSQKREVAL